VALQLARAIAEYRAFIPRSANAPAFAQQRKAAQAMVARLEKPCLSLSPPQLHRGGERVRERGARSVAPTNSYVWERPSP
jgi:hypothetical protein